MTARLRLFERLGELKRLPAFGDDPSLAARLFREVTTRIAAAEREHDVAVALDGMVVRAAAGAILGDCPAEFVSDAEGRRAWRDMSRQAATAVLADAPSRVAEYYGHRFDDVWDQAAHPPSPPLARQAAERLSDVAAAPRAGYANMDRVKCIPFPRETQGEHSLACALIAALLARERDVDGVEPCLMALFHHLAAASVPMIDHEAERVIGRETVAAFEARARERILAALPAFSGGRIARALARYDEEAAADDPFVEADILDRAIQARYYERTASLTLAGLVREHGFLNEGALGEAQRRILAAYGLIGEDST